MSHNDFRVDFTPSNETNPIKKENPMTIKNPTPKPTGTAVEDFGNGIVIKWNVFK